MQEKYIATGWLGMLLGTKFWYDLTKPDIYEQKLQDLIAALGDKGKRTVADGGLAHRLCTGLQPQPTIILPHAETFNPGPAPAAGGSSQKSVPMTPARPQGGGTSKVKKGNLKCLKWSTAQVTTWLNDNKLQPYSKKFVYPHCLRCISF